MNEQKKPQRFPTECTKVDDPERPLATIVCNPFFESKLLHQFGGNDRLAHWYWELKYRCPDATPQDIACVWLNSEQSEVRLVLDDFQIPFSVTLRVWTNEAEVQRLIVDTLLVCPGIARFILDYARFYVMTRTELDSALKDALLDDVSAQTRARLGQMDRDCSRLIEIFPPKECTGATVRQCGKWTTVYISTRGWRE